MMPKPSPVTEAGAFTWQESEVVGTHPSRDVFEAAAALMVRQGGQACVYAAHCALEARASADAAGELAWIEVWDAIAALQTARRQLH